jgi:hypothetical protein
MGALGIARGLPLTVLLALLLAMLLREVGDTLPDPVRPFGQRSLAVLHLLLDLLAKRPVGGRRRGAAPNGARREHSREDRRGRFAFDRRRDCRLESSCHASPRFITRQAREWRPFWRMPVPMTCLLLQLREEPVVLRVPNQWISRPIFRDIPDVDRSSWAGEGTVPQVMGQQEIILLSSGAERAARAKTCTRTSRRDPPARSRVPGNAHGYAGSEQCPFRRLRLDAAAAAAQQVQRYACWAAICA